MLPVQEGPYHDTREVETHYLLGDGCLNGAFYSLLPGQKVCTDRFQTVEIIARFVQGIY